MAILFPTHAEFVETWPAQAALGRASFVLRYGVGWAVMTLLLLWVANWILGWDLYPWSGRMPTRALLFQLVGMPVAGCLLALLTWRHYQRRYRRLTEDTEQNL